MAKRNKQLDDHDVLDEMSESAQSLDEHVNILHAALFTPSADEGGWGLPLLFVGGPGQGKTRIIKNYASACSFHAEVLSAERGEGAFGVVPAVQNGRIHYYPPAWVDSFKDGRGLVFTDELTTMAPIIQAPCLGLVGEKRIAGHYLPPGVRVIGACNPSGQAANGHDIAAPLANRFGWMRWNAPTIDEHVRFILGGATSPFAPVDAAAEEQRVTDAWGIAWSRAAGLETAFHRTFSQWKNIEPPPGADSSAFPSDRTWEYATRALAASFIHKLTDASRDLYVGSFIGAKAMEAFAGFMKIQDIPAIDDVLDRKVDWQHDELRLDKTYVVLNSAVAMIGPANATNREARALRLWELLDSVGEAYLEIVIPIAQQIMNARLLKGPVAQRVMARVSPVVDQRALK